MISYNYKCVLLLFFCFLALGRLAAQDSITTADLEKYSYHFDLNENGFDGPGADILSDAVNEASVVMLGNHERSKLELRFTENLIQMLNQNAFKHMVMEIGPASVDVLNNSLSKIENAKAVLKKINQSYGLKVKGQTLTPIPEFKSEEAADMIQSAVNTDWQIASVGIEYWTAYKMILEYLFQNMSENKQNENQVLYQKAKVLLNKLYGDMEEANNENLLRFITAVQESTIIQQYLTQMSLESDNESLIKGFNSSLDYWQLYGSNAFYKKHEYNTKNDKGLLRESLEQFDFDFETDKIFLYMWRQALTKGRNGYGFYGVGNMISELAAYHEKKSLSIALLRRYHKQDNVEKDALENLGYYSQSFRPFIELGVKDKWTLIDLRSFNADFNFGPYAITKDMENVFSRYDMLIIPKLDAPATNNF